MCICTLTSSHILELVTETGVLVEHGILVGRICKHTVFLALTVLSLIASLFHCIGCSIVTSIDRHSEVRTPCRPNHLSRSLVRTIITELDRQALPLAVNAHVLWPIRRLAVRYRYRICVSLSSAHGTTVQIGSITLALCFGHEVFFEFLVCQMLLVFGARINTLSRSLRFENVHCLIRQRTASCFCSVVWHVWILRRNCGRHDLGRVAIFVSARPCNVLVIVVS